MTDPNVDLPPPMHERRPDWLEEVIAIDVTSAQEGIPAGYRYNGDSTDYEARCLGLDGLYAGAFWMSQLVKQMSAERDDQPLRILDIGAGEAAFVLRCVKAGHKAQGLSIHDYGKVPRFQQRTLSKLTNGEYILGDANNLDQVEGLRDDYDLIMSWWGFPHFADPISALEQATNRLALGGVIGINTIMRNRKRDNNSAYNPPVDPSIITDALQNSGFDTEGTTAVDDLTSRVLFSPFRAIRKSITPVRFPIQYRKSKPR